ncbi:glycosyltransferase family 4 protein [Flavobacterium sp. '19STA2R22 D10 B1']|uniref:glycosyltransferase family 4 protein n=1 Tax=Flavobacterium aerium TaxID=3037261 RepID=UPI00278C3ABC|nr:glycosyltransferase family 4 protein [Flavobacterium sp. '19STA2R22 D10 B1']
MTILFLTDEYNHPNFPPTGGIGSFIKSMATELTKKGHQVIIFALCEEEQHFFDGTIEVKMIKSHKLYYKPFAKHLNSIFKRIGLVTLSAKLERIYLARRLKNFIKQSGKKIDLIEANDNQGLFLKVKGIAPLVVRCHGSVKFLNTCYNGYQLSPIIEEIETMAFKNVKNIVAVSNFSAINTAKIFNTGKIDVIYNGIDTNLFSPKEASNTIPYSIFYYGTLSEQKGSKILCEVFNEVVKIQPKATLHFIGKGKKYWEYLYEDVIQEKDKVFYTDSVQYVDLPNMISQANVLVFATFGENLPLVVIESMAMEKPVVISNIDVAPEIINHGQDGYIVNSNEEFVQTILNLFNNPDLATKIGVNARQKVINQFSLDKTVENTLQYYNKTINSFEKNEETL